jgi:hypothetical protein
MSGFFRGIDLTDPAAAAAKLKIGTRVVTRFEEQRAGDVLDFWYDIA